MIGVLIGLALFLVALYGIVSFIQRKRELSRGLDVVMQERNKIAGALSRLSTDAEFLNVYREGETGKTAKALRERMDNLTSVFRETTDECDKLANGKYHRLDEQVHFARVRESFAKLSNEISRLGKSFHEFHETIENSRAMVDPLQQRFENVRSRITDILHENCPSAWVQDWRALERGLTSLSLGEPPASIDDPVVYFSDKVELWMERAEALSVWSEWTHGFEERTKTLVICRDRLLTAGAGNAYVCRMIEELMEAVNEVVALNPVQLVDERSIHQTKWIQQQLPIVLSLSMQFLSVLSHPETVASAVKQCVYDANHLIDTVKSDVFVKKEQAVVHADADKMGNDIDDKAKMLHALAETVTQISTLSSISVREAIPYLDVLLSTCARLQQYILKIEQFYLVHASGSKALRQRIDEILNHLAHAMASLAEAGLHHSKEYEKLSTWQSDIQQYEEASEPVASIVGQYEKRIANELIIVDGLVKGNKSLDSSLQGHLDKLSHSGKYSGRYTGSRTPSEFPTGIPSTGHGDLLGAAFGALMIGEILSDESWDNNFDIW